MRFISGSYYEVYEAPMNPVTSSSFTSTLGPCLLPDFGYNCQLPLTLLSVLSPCLSLFGQINRTRFAQTTGVQAGESQQASVAIGLSFDRLQLRLPLRPTGSNHCQFASISSASSSANQQRASHCFY